MMHTRSIARAKVMLAHVVPLLAVVALAPAALSAQTAVTGRVVDGTGAPVSFANVQLRTLSDSSLVQAVTTDPRGSFVLQDTRPGTYRLYVSRLGYRSLASDVLTVTGEERLQLPPLALEPEAIALEGVSVEATKSLYQQQADRMIINVESSPTLAGASALQVLERSPGVVVDKVSGSVSMIGKDGVRVMVNGKPSYLPADALVQYLSGMSADNLERIELITSPPASLDAEGNAGYINLVLKQREDQGLSGSLALSGGYGEGEIGSGSTNLSFQGGRSRFHGSYSFTWNAQRQTVTNFRRSVGPDGVVEMPAASRRDPVQRNHNARLGFEYDLSDRTTVGALVAAYDNRWSMDALNQLAIERDGAPITRVDSDNREVNLWRHAMGNLSLQHKLTGADVLRMDVDYLRYDNDNPTVYVNTSTDVASGAVTRTDMESGKSTPLSIVVAKADYTRTHEGWELGAGIKGAFSRFTNETSLQGALDESWVSEAGFGSKSRLREDVLALYGTASFTPREATTLKLGLRYELTDSNLGSEDEADLVDRRFGSFFPSVALSQKLGDERQIDASYTRRITRPSFSDMAPFLYFFDPQTFFTGNPALQPAITNTLKLDGTYRRVIASLQYAWEDSTIVPFQNRFLPEYNIHVLFPTNFAGTRTATALLAAPLDVTPWWSTQNNAMLTWQEVDGVRNEVPMLVTSTSYRLNSTQNFTLPREYTAEVGGFYQSESLLGTGGFGATWQVNVALQHTLPNAGRLTLAVDDVFDSFEWRWTTGAPGDPLYIDTALDMWWRKVSLTYSMSFGGGKTESQRTGASEDERGRVR